MTTAPDSVERFDKEGVFPTSAALTARRLREKAPGLWPSGIKGGGKNQPQVEPHHLANFILAQAAHLPTDAGKAVAALWDLPMTEQECLRQVRPNRAPVATMIFAEIGQPLGPLLTHYIASAADPAMREAMQHIAGITWRLTLSVDPPLATVSYPGGVDEIWINVFGRRTFDDRGQRLIALPFKVITIAGELWEDSRNAALAGATLPVDLSSRPARTAEEGEGSLNSADPTPCARASATRSPPCIPMMMPTMMTGLPL